MSGWFSKVKAAKEDDFLTIAQAICYYHEQAEDGITDVTPSGRLWDTAKRIPGLMTFRFQQLQEVEAILDHYTNLANRRYAEKKLWYLEQYPKKQLTERAAGEMANGADEVFNLRAIITEIAMVRNKLLGVTKGLESLHFQMSNLVKLREAGIEDATF